MIVEVSQAGPGDQSARERRRRTALGRRQSHERSVLRPSKSASPSRARRRASWRASSASWTEPSIPVVGPVLNFEVDDIDQAVDALASRGVRFERYDNIEQDDRGVFREEGP